MGAKTNARFNLTLSVSKDEGNSFEYVRTIDAGFAAYSSLVEFEVDGRPKIGVLYERKLADRKYKYITFESYDIGQPESCGDKLCGVGEYCCDPLCAKCVPDGAICTQGCADPHPEPPMDECSIEVLSVGKGGTFSFDKGALDKVLERENWDGETLRIDAGDLTVIKEVTVFRNSIGAYGRSSWAGSWSAGHKITFVE